MNTRKFPSSIKFTAAAEEKKIAAVHEGLCVEPLVSVCKLVEKEIVIFVESSTRWQIATILLYTHC